MNIEKVHVMGNSMGGFISAHFAKMYPERTLSATLVDPAGVKAPTPSDMENMLASGENPFLIDSREGFDAFFAMTMAEPPWFPDFILDAVAEKYQNRKSELLHIFKGFHGKDMLDAQLTSITPPVLLLWGGKDQLLHVSSVEVWKQIPNIQVHVWPEIGHMPMMEVPGDSAKVVKDFINSLSQS